VVAVLGYFGVTQFTGGAEAPTAGDSTTQVVQQPAAPTPSRPDTNAAPSGGLPPARTTQLSNPVNPGTTPPRTEPQPTRPTPTPTTTPPALTVTQQLNAWAEELLASDNPTIARSILRQLPPLRTGLQGTDLGLWHFVEFAALSNLNDDATCRAARDVVRTSRVADHLSMANGVLSSGGCGE
jgi:hypothetical protein